MYQTDHYEGIIAETVMLAGHNGDDINAYFARPLGPGPHPAVVIIHHMPGWDLWYREVTHKFAHHGFLALSPNLYYRDGHGTPEDVAAKVRAGGGVADDQVVGDVAGALRVLRNHPTSNGKVAVFGTCSGARHAYLSACKLTGFAGVIDCWGGRIVMNEQELTAKQPVAPVEYTATLSCPVLGIFGDEDFNPTPDQVNALEAALKAHGKSYEFHRYPEAGHGFFYYDRPAYRQAQTMDGWQKIFAFLDRTVRT
jgi:carboxymethylenebutenolidase